MMITKNFLFKIAFLAVMTIALANTKAYAQVKVEVDYKSAAQIAENTAIAAATESIIKDTLKTSRQRNDSIAVMASTITVLRKVYHLARQNITGFGKESAIYKKIYNKVLALVPKAGAAISTVLKDPIHGASSYENIMKIQRRLSSLSKQYTDIVANGRVPNPFTGKTKYKYSKCPKCGGAIEIIETNNPRKPYVYACKNGNCGWDTGSDPEEPDEGSNGDGYNFLSSRDRYMMASAILTDMNAIDWQLTIILYGTKQKSAKMNILSYVDFHSYCTAWETKRTAQSIINRIEKLKDKVEDL